MTSPETIAERATLARRAADAMEAQLRAAFATDALIRAHGADILRSALVEAYIAAAHRPPAGHDAGGVALTDALNALAGRGELLTVAEARACARVAMGGKIKPLAVFYVVREGDDSVALVEFGRRLGIRRAWRYLSAREMRAINAEFAAAFDAAAAA